MIQHPTGMARHESINRVSECGVQVKSEWEKLDRKRFKMEGMRSKKKLGVAGGEATDQRQHRQCDQAQSSPTVARDILHPCTSCHNQETRDDPTHRYGVHCLLSNPERSLCQCSRHCLKQLASFDSLLYYH